jgi:putative transcriptional regulator
MPTFPKLRAAMAEHGITNQKLAKILGVTNDTVGFKINGKSQFTLEQAKKIADYFGKSIDEIFFG